MNERRAHRRIDVDYWASLNHPLLGTITGDVNDMSVSGLSLTLDEELRFFVMMELDVRIHGEGFEKTAPSLPVQVVRVKDREIGLRFIELCEDYWTPPLVSEFDLKLESSTLFSELSDSDEYDLSA